MDQGSQMEEDDGFEELFSMELKGGGSAGISFPVPDHLKIFTRSYDNVRQSIEYYLLARYAFLHDMQTSFMINTFWCVEHLMLSILCFKYEDQAALGGKFKYHDLPKYWDEAKSMSPEEYRDCMSGFDDYVGIVTGYYKERYPNDSNKIKLTASGKMPKFSVPGDVKKTVNFGKVMRTSLSGLDHYVSFMLHDVTVFKGNCSIQLMQMLGAHNNVKLYQTDNEYSVIYPNKKYKGKFSS